MVQDDSGKSKRDLILESLLSHKNSLNIILSKTESSEGFWAGLFCFLMAGLYLQRTPLEAWKIDWNDNVTTGRKQPLILTGSPSQTRSCFG